MDEIDRLGVWRLLGALTKGGEGGGEGGQGGWGLVAWLHEVQQPVLEQWWWWMGRIGLVMRLCWT